MPELPPPPPRRPAPEHLRDEIARTLATATTRRPRWRTVIVPVAAAALVGATIFGVSALSGRQVVLPAQTASPYPVSATPPPPATTGSATTGSTSKPPSPSPTQPTVPAELNVRPMTSDEIAADTKSCRRRTGSEDDLPRRGAVRTKFAVVQLAAGVGKPLTGPVRMLLIQDAAGSWVCENGENMSWTAGDLAAEKPTKAVPVWEVANYGDFNSTCADHPKTSGNELFAVSDEVAVARMRLDIGAHAGPWQTAEPAGGLVHFLFGLEGQDAHASGVSAEFQFLDDRGLVLTIQPYGERGTPTTKKVQEPVPTCADAMSRFHPPAAIVRPKSDKAGIATCLGMAKEWAGQQELPFRSQDYQARLVVSTSAEWGAVLSNGRHRVGCSLFPTKEISRLVADKDTVSKEAFAFALNPIGSTGESLWASGRVPSDVRTISYRLPGSHDVNAKINSAGYWMLKYHRTDADLAEGNVEDWAPVVVTVTRASGTTQTFTLTFTVSTMCNQVSHGC